MNTLFIYAQSDADRLKGSFDHAQNELLKQHVGVAKGSQLEQVEEQTFDRICILSSDAALVSQAQKKFNAKEWVLFRPFLQNRKKHDPTGEVVFDVRSWGLLLHFVLQKQSALSLSIIVLSYNEGPSLLEGLHEIHAFCNIYIPNFEVIVVNDGSTDNSETLLKNYASSQLSVMTHAYNQGMGGSMYSGYSKASKDYCLMLPADRQLRVQQILPFLDEALNGDIAATYYSKPHSGFLRGVMSYVFRKLVKYVGGLQVDFAGIYMFPRAMFDAHQDVLKRFQTFVLSFVLLQKCKDACAKFLYIHIEAFPRDQGESKEAKGRSIKKVWRELFLTQKS